ncbi:MAG: helix-turn-helix domain-containing protein [Blautia sp.]|nr:helix-turn-helix domain-containing protein [Blautia sp.]MDD7729161.1 helix-turn-helix domain-containing protein [Clostridia bacterium]MDY5664039.1 helix-turn-helix domain-containing protein [Blautia sp.]
MDTKKIGAFLKQCRKEKNLTQEQLAEKLGVSARTVSRWETGSNMPDLSVLVELSDYYDIEIKELLDGERSSTMNKEMKETLDKVADYEDWVKQKALKAGNLAFASMFLIGVGAIILQLLLAVDIRLVLGETVTTLVGGIVYAFIMVHNGIWDKGLSEREALWRDFLTSVICAGIFSVFYGICLGRMGATEKQTIYFSLIFLVGITIVAFIVLRILSYFNRKKRRISAGEQKEISMPKAGCMKICNAKDIVEAERIVELLKENGITAFSQESAANVTMYGTSGFGIYGVDILVETNEAKKALQIIEAADDSQSSEKF